MPSEHNTSDEWLEGETYIHEPPQPIPSPMPPNGGPRARPAEEAGPAHSPQFGDAAAALEAARTATPGRSDPARPGAQLPHRKNIKNFPGFIARSAMFRVTRSNLNFNAPTEINIAGGSMTISGPRLCMRDKAIWETAVQLAKERAPGAGEAFEVELRDFARRMGSSNKSGKALESIWASLERLAKVTVQFETDHGRCKGIGSLLASAMKVDGRTRLRLNPDFIIPALSGDRQFQFDGTRRNGMSTALGQWLHDYYSTHKDELDIDLKYLRGLCGYDGAARHFPAKLRDAMKELALIAPNLIASHSIIETGRASDKWKLRVVMGTEKPSFLRASTQTPPPSGARRGGVAL